MAAMSAGRRGLGEGAAVGWFGNSEGGWVGHREAVRSGQAGFGGTNSCPGTTPGQADRHAVTKAIASEARPEHDKAAALRLYDDLAEAAARDRDYAYVQHLLTSAIQRDMRRPYLEPLAA